MSKNLVPILDSFVAKISSLKFIEACTEIQKCILNVLQMTNGSSQARQSKAADKGNAKPKLFVSHSITASPCQSPSERGVQALLVS